jgi:N12 class adenine-specific DNA methylase
VDVDVARGELELIAFVDPTSGARVPAEDYLAGDVSAKLAVAIAAVAEGYGQFAPNVTALQAVQLAQRSSAATPAGNSGRGTPT